MAEGVASNQWRREMGHCRMNMRRGVQRHKDKYVVLVEIVVDYVE